MTLVRPAAAGDAEAVAQVYRPYVLDSAASFELDPPDAVEVSRRMLAEPRLPWLVATRDDAVVGYAYASQHRARPAYRWAVDVSVYLREDERGRGTARELYAVLLPAVADLGHLAAFAAITLPNPASVGLHESLGFTAVGVFKDVGHKLGRWHDVGWWRCTLAPLPAQPAEPRRWEPPPA